MIKIETENNFTSVCNFDYLSQLMGGKQQLIKKIMDTFLIQVQDELISMNNAITKKDFATTKNLAHTMKSSVSIMGISVLAPILEEMEELGIKTTSSDSDRIEKLTALNLKLNVICKKAFVEIENYHFS